uniref:Uncharacterized protein n=1 Tax=Elaeophora elaphi TaxID=1147741 RepID=A0A0R3S5P1_9BILA
MKLGFSSMQMKITPSQVFQDPVMENKVVQAEEDKTANDGRATPTEEASPGNPADRKPLADVTRGYSPQLRSGFLSNLSIQPVPNANYRTKERNSKKTQGGEEEKNDDGLVSATLSESMPNVLHTPEPRSTERRRRLNEVSSSAEKVKKDERKGLKQREYSWNELATRQSQIGLRVTSISPQFPLCTIPVEQKNVPKKEMEKSAKIPQVASLSTPINPLSPRSTVFMQHGTIPETQMAQSEDDFSRGSIQSEVARNPAPAECANCKVMRSELANVTSKVNRYEIMLKSFCGTENLEATGSNTEIYDKATVNPIEIGDSEEVKQWKEECVGLNMKLTSTLHTFQTDTIQQLNAYQIKLDDVLKEREIILAKLTKAMENIRSLEDMIKEQKEKNFQLSNIIQDMVLKSKVELEQKEKELRSASEANLRDAQEMCRSKQSHIVMLKELLEKSDSENAELRRRVGRSTDDLENVKFGEMGVEEFQHRLKQKLTSLLEQFKQEAKKPEHAWMGEENMRLVVHGFEEVIKTILGEEPDLGRLAERVVGYLGGRVERGESSAEKESSLEEQAFKDFKTEMSEEIESILEKFHVKQTEELNTNICKMMSYLEVAEQKVDNTVVKRIDELGNLLNIIDSKQTDIQLNEESINRRLQNLSGTIENIGIRTAAQAEDRSDEITTFLAEKHNIKAALLYVEQLGGDQMDLKTRVQNIETNYARLQEQTHADFTPERSIVRMRHDTTRQSAEHRRMKELSPQEAYRGSPSSRREETQGSTPDRGSTIEDSKSE